MGGCIRVDIEILANDNFRVDQHQVHNTYLLYLMQMTRTSSVFQKYIPGQGYHSTLSVCQNMDILEVGHNCRA